MNAVARNLDTASADGVTRLRYRVVTPADRRALEAEPARRLKAHAGKIEYYDHWSLNGSP